MNYTETLPTKINASPIRIPNTTVNPPIPHVPLLKLEAPFPDVWLGVGLDNVEDGEGDDDDSDDDNTEDNDEGGGGNEIDVAEGPTLQNF